MMIRFLDQIESILTQYIQLHKPLCLGQTKSEDRMHHGCGLHGRHDLLRHHGRHDLLRHHGLSRHHDRHGHHDRHDHLP